MSSNWIKPDTAPKDGLPFLGRFKAVPFAVATCWNSASKQWCAAMPRADLYQGVLEHYFEDDFLKENELEGWQPMPEFD